MAEPMKNANEIRGVLDGGRLQFRAGGKWIDAGGDANTWLVLLVCAGMRDGAYRIKPDGVMASVEAQRLAGLSEFLRRHAQQTLNNWDREPPPSSVTGSVERMRAWADAVDALGVAAIDDQTKPRQTPTRT